jgi:hypothetical protein
MSIDNVERCHTADRNEKDTRRYTIKDIPQMIKLNP